MILCWLNISFSLSILSINDLPEKIYNGARYPHVIPIPITLITTNYPNHSQPCCSCCGAKKSNEAYYQITREKDEPGQLWTYGSSPTRSLACTTDFSKLAQGGGNFSHRFLFGLGLRLSVKVEIMEIPLNITSWQPGIAQLSAWQVPPVAAVPTGKIWNRQAAPRRCIASLI